MVPACSVLELKDDWANTVVIASKEYDADYEDAGTNGGVGLSSGFDSSSAWEWSWKD